MDDDNVCEKCKKEFQNGEKKIFRLEKNFHEDCFVCDVCKNKIAKLPTELELGTASYDGLICRQCWISRKTAPLKNIGKT